MHSYAADAKDGQLALEVPVGLFLAAGVVYSFLTHVLSLFEGSVTVFGFTFERSPIRAPSALVIYLALYGVFNLTAWHWPGIGRVLRLDDVRGEWNGSFESSSPDVGSGTVTLLIKQQWRRMSIEFLAWLDDPDENGKARQSYSTSNMAALSKDHELRYEYRLSFVSNIPPHDGTVRVELHLDANPPWLRGRYYTNEEGGGQHYGELKCARRTKRARTQGEVLAQSTALTGVTLQRV